jgi:hypothetical protein
MDDGGRWIGGDRPRPDQKAEIRTVVLPTQYRRAADPAFCRIEAGQNLLISAKTGTVALPT